MWGSAGRIARPQLGGAVVAALAAALLVLHPAGGTSLPSLPSLPSLSGGADDTVARATAALANLPLQFVENGGQLDGRVAFSVQGREATVYFTATGITYALTDDDLRWVVEQRFEGARAVTPVARDQAPGVVSHFRAGDGGAAGLRTYSTLVYDDLWPGIDLVVHGGVNQLKSEYVVSPGADPSQIRIDYDGARSVALEEGALVVATGAGDLTEQPPVTYQQGDGRREAVESAYVLGRGGSYGFRLGAYDAERPLVIDPVTVVYAGYIGGSNQDRATSVAVDASGNTYVAGWTGSTETTFPETVGPDLTHGGSTDGFVAKVNSSGTSLLYAGYLGGSNRDEIEGIAVDGAGNAYVTGLTDSTAATFPVTGGPDLTENGGLDAFVAKINAGGTALAYAGYIGGDSTDIGRDIAVDARGRASIAGQTSSSEATFPEVVGPDLSWNGGLDAFVARLNASGSALLSAGYVGGSGDDAAMGIGLDGAGVASIGGFTESTAATFPEVTGPDLTSNGARDGFVARLSSTAASLVYAGFIGGSAFDTVEAIAVDATGATHLGGFTQSNQTTFPEVVGPDLTFNGSTDGFVARVNAGGTALTYAGYIGGSGGDQVEAVALDPAGNLHLAGYTTSDESSFPTLVGPDLGHNGGLDGFLARVSASGSILVFSGYIGGSQTDVVEGVAFDAFGNAYVAGYTGSGHGTFPVVRGPDLTYNGTEDAFVAKISPPVPAVSVSGVTVTEPDTTSTRVTVTLRLSNPYPEPIAVDVATVAGTATPGVDYDPKAASRTFDPGQITKTFTFFVLGDTLDEPNEQLTVELADPTNATLGTASAAVTITDNDAPPALRIDDVAEPEGAAGTDRKVAFTVRLSTASAQTVSVQFATANGTAASPADYWARPLTTLTFEPGQTTATVLVSIRGDGSVEPDETFHLNLSTPTNATIADSQGTATILNDD